MTKKEFIYENVSFTYNLIQEDRKTISVTVFPNKTIVVKTPCISDQNRIDSFLKRKCSWVLKQCRYFNQFKNAPIKEYISGESIQYLGRTYKLLVRKTEEKEHVALQKGILTVYTFSPASPENTKKMIKKWKEQKCEKVFNKQLDHCFKIFNYDEKPKLKIRKLNKRWGSYLNDNTIILNPELIKASKKHINYVITHELCHVEHKNHNNNFFNLLKCKISDWEKVKLELELRLFAQW